MSLIKIIKSFSLLLIIAITLVSCMKYEEVEMVKVHNVGIKKFSGKGIIVEVAMQIKNPNNYKISIVDSDLDLFIKDDKIGTANIKENIVLPKNSNKIHRFTIESTFEDMLKGALPTIMGVLFNQSVELQVKGNIKARAKSLSKRFPVDFKEKVSL